MSQSTPYFISTKNTAAGTGSDAVLSFAQRVNADNTTQLNNLTQTTVPMDGAMITNQTGFAINGNGIELTGDDAYVKCICNLHTMGSAARVNLIVRFSQNGTLFGPISACGYSRNLNGHMETSYHLQAWTKMATGDIITIETLREANAGSVTLASAGTSNLILERLVNV